MNHRPTLALLLLGLSLPFLPAAAQSGPLPLLPSPTAVPEPPPDKVSVVDLPALNPDEVGLLDDAHGGLGVDLWHGSSLALIGKGLPLLPDQPGWRSLRALQLRLLQSGATLPAGKPPGEPVIALRASKLAAMGAGDATLALLQRVPGPALTPTLRRLLIDNALLAGDNAAACSQEAAFRAGGNADNFSTELQVFCQFLAGKGGAAGLGVDLLRDQKLKDPLFFAAADTLSGLPPVRPDGLRDISPLSLAMAGLAKLPLPDSVVIGAAPTLLAPLARAAGLGLEARLLAAERAVGLGVAAPDLVRALYELVPFSPAELATAATETGRSGRGRALLYRAALAQPLAGPRADLIQRGLAADGAAGPMVYAALLAGLPAGPDLLAATPWVVRALLATGNSEAVRPWLGQLRSDALLNPGSAGLLAGLKPLATLAGLEAPLGSSDLTTWRQARNETPSDATRHTLLLLCLLSALKADPPEADWLTLLDGPPVISGKVSRSALTAGLAVAAANRRRGETVLYTLLCLGEQRDVEPGEFAQLIADLGGAGGGLEGDARALAVELALAYGL